MVFLEFIVVGFSKDCTSEELRTMVKECGVDVIDEQMLFLDSSTAKPTLREGIVKVHYKVHSYHDHLTLQEAYNRLTRDWTIVSNRYRLENARPILFLQFSNAFPRMWDAAQLEIEVKLALGTMVRPSQFMVHFSWPRSSKEYDDCPSKVMANFYHDIKRAELWFGDICKLSFNYSAIRGIMVHYDADVDIILNLTNPPLVFSFSTIKNMKDVSRVATIPFCEESLPPTVLGKSTSLRLKISDQEVAQKLISRLHYRCGRIPVQHVAIANDYLQKPSELAECDTELPDYECGYLFSALLGRNYVVQLQNVDTWSSFRTFFKEWSIEDPRNLQRTLVDLLRLLDDGIIVNYLGAAQRLMNYYRQTTPEKLPLARGTCMVPHAVITPTRILLWPKDVMTENRILRKFDGEYAIRVTFREDNLCKLSLKAASCSQEIFDRVIREPMLNGLDIAGRHYDFLAWSNSQLRDHGVWMYAQDSNGHNAVSIRKWMGDFSQIPNVAKFMSRMGQCFSQTEDPLAVPLDHSRFVIQPDIVGGVHPITKKPYCFSDGVGQISKSLVEKVVKNLELPSDTSAFQIRFDGCKGMLVLNPLLEDVDIIFRESMNKFPCEGVHKLEIVKPSAPGWLYGERCFYITVGTRLSIVNQPNT